MTEREKYWTDRYKNKNTGWDIGAPSTPLKTYIDQIEDKSITILIPGAGNAYEAEYLWKLGFKNVNILDISQFPLDNFKSRVSDFPEDQLLCEDFFDHIGRYNLILEQTFFCSFTPHLESRKAYAQKMFELLAPGGILAGLWFNFPLTVESGPPYGGSKDEYLKYFSPLFLSSKLELCYNSIKPREGNELFGIMMKAEH